MPLEARQRVDKTVKVTDKMVLNTEPWAQGRDCFSEQDTLSDSDSAVDTAASEAKKTYNKFAGFENEFTQVEKDDIEIHKTQLQMEKDKELNSAEGEIDTEVNKSSKSRELEEQKKALRLKLEGDVDPLEKENMMNELNDLEANLSKAMELDRANQSKGLDEKRKKRQEYLALKKM